ncbi:hypothetical protein GLOTRDRAFT_93399 [Gloeophyllum trabeum ATCC 11539]|uniref:Uncharacterized protein n=1 Tax=Gloeophyllum trabeum (strain ATCC 11539 / FP-39264 / Madison 617) TaxID=670483 RepID=S7Q753_GLOTA|nr:uncharacterized protein GLOTRDRAFT_93399 [Gloeophyllum trabeum ATCC 11539]EPQ55856.1 hypothetical protein GLOTRDRAFT_93399 [Gloeophyllum trabeum ATCC 11539]
MYLMGYIERVQPSLVARAACRTISSCGDCVANPTCAFDKTKFTCTVKSALVQQVTTTNACFLVQAMQKTQIQEFPATKTSTAGVIPSGVNKLFNDMQRHIFLGNPGDTTKGQHINTAWVPTNSGITKLIANDTSTHLAQYSFKSATASGIKTVWDNSRKDFYDQTDVRNIVPSRPGVLSVATPFNNNIWLTAVITGGDGTTCFPKSAHAVSQLLGYPC